MSKCINVIATLTMLISAVFFSIIGRNQFMQLMKGPSPLAAESDLQLLQDSYVSYNAAYPVAAYPDEYYSGDPDRVLKQGFVLYDEALQNLITVTIDDGLYFRVDDTTRTTQCSENQ